METIGVIFDMDGVLVDSGEAHFESWRRLGEELGAGPFTREQFNATFGSRSADIIARLFGITQADEVRRLDDRKEAIYRELIRGRVPVMPGAMETITALHLSGFRIAVGSSGPPENIDLVCDAMGLRAYLAAVVTGADVQRGKPDPQVFLLAAERLGVPPMRCAVVEDAPLGVEAARRAGMRCIALAGSHRADALTEADLVVSRLDAISPRCVTDLVGLPR